jgi:thiamine biosynthesis protein ThiS
MKLIINGEEKSVENVSSLSSLLQHLGLKADRVAIELNREIVARGVWDSTILTDGDRLEIVQFVGGGSQLVIGDCSHRATIDRCECSAHY